MEQKNRPRSGSLVLFILAGILAGICCCTNFSVLRGETALEDIGNFLVVDDGEFHPADQIHVLGGRFERLDYGIQLYKQGYGQHLFITGGKDDAPKFRLYAIDQGVTIEDIFPEESWAITTFEEALELKQFLDHEPGTQSVIIVSSPYHMRRAQLAFKWVLGDQVQLQFVPVPFEFSNHQRRWWADKQTRAFVITEYLKIVGLPVERYISLGRSG